ncbi:DUF5133 domain-containing protein [Streptomyces canus]|uniref:DUF5133 domain-containing protein n=1 Tax=Streptomyces canus TaxID=58343 RepID=UPI00338E244C
MITQTRQEIKRQLEDASYTLCVVTGTPRLDTAPNVTHDRHGARGIYTAPLAVQALATVGFVLRRRTPHRRRTPLYGTTLRHLRSTPVGARRLHRSRTAAPSSALPTPRPDTAPHSGPTQATPCLFPKATQPEPGAHHIARPASGGGCQGGVTLRPRG